MQAFLTICKIYKVKQVKFSYYPVHMEITAFEKLKLSDLL